MKENNQRLNVVCTQDWTLRTTTSSVISSTIRIHGIRSSYSTAHRLRCFVGGRLNLFGRVPLKWDAKSPLFSGPGSHFSLLFCLHPFLACPAPFPLTLFPKFCTIRNLLLDIRRHGSRLVEFRWLYSFCMTLVDMRMIDLADEDLLTMNQYCPAQKWYPAARCSNPTFTWLHQYQRTRHFRDLLKRHRQKVDKWIRFSHGMKRNFNFCAFTVFIYLSINLSYLSFFFFEKIKTKQKNCSCTTNILITKVTSSDRLLTK